MVCPWCGFLCIAHSGTSIVILVEESGCFLGNAEIPEDAPDKKYHLTGVIGGHKFRVQFFAFICYCATRDANADAAEKSTCFYASSPIRVGISMSIIGVELGSILKEDVLFVAANRW